MDTMSFKSKNITLIIVILVTVFWIFQYPKISQSPYFHLFADDRTLLGIPHFWNVLSNLTFFWVGFLGFKELKKVDESIKTPWIVFFLGVFLTAAGSVYYHLNPNNNTLVFDRLPMTLGFMALVSLLLTERVSPRLGGLLLYPLLMIGFFSVLYWNYTEKVGAGDLRLYLWVQFGGLAIAFAIIVMYDAVKLSNKFLLLGFGLYAVAKVFEAYDVQIYILLKQQMSGHTLKHFAAAAGAYSLLKSHR